ncbi:MAG: Oligopeptide ABC transporter, permease protein OppB (TC 3.A.1.5.1) [uncultured Caballeronia sp.]|nr:MAG: Oligopeptide ABC transporter, permease protein OppB (TC 3.A.1.5.1) [uncultured Caballeronia sp.]
MWSYTLRRVLFTLPTLLIVITVCYLLLHATPGGPFDGERQVSAEVLANLQAKYYLGEPLWKQYVLYLDDLLHGDLGASFRYADWSVNDLVLRALPVSLAIGGVAMLLAIVVGVALGVVAALRRIGPVLILVFAILLKWLPAGGWNDFEMRYMVLPVALLAMINVATVGRVTRASLIEVLNTNYIRTARAKGLSLRIIVLHHALKPTLIPVVSVIGPLAISSITAAVVTESVFSLPGIGKLIVNGAANRDYTLVLGLIVLVTAVAVLLNLLADLAYAWLDPKIRY